MIIQNKLHKVNSLCTPSAASAAPPTRLSELSAKVVLNYRRGSAYRWVSCLGASRVVGGYEKGATQAIARELALSVSQVENLARAGLTYRLLRRHAADLPALRRSLTPSHFAVLGDLMRRFDTPTWQGLSALRDAAHAGLSVGDFRLALETEWGGYRPAWPGQVNKLAGLLDRLISDFDVPAGLRDQAKSWRAGLDAWMEPGAED